MKKQQAEKSGQLNLFGEPLEPYRPEPKRRTQSQAVAMFEGEEIRFIEISGRRWWVAVDVCRVLGVTNPTAALDRLDADEKTLSSTYTQGGKLCLLNEFGLYHLTLTTRPRKTHPAFAKVNRFRRWVTHEVLPEIRSTGKYVAVKPKVDRITIIQKRLKCDRDTAIVRDKSISVSKQFHRSMAKKNAKPADYREQNNALYEGVFGTDAKGLRRAAGLPSGRTPLDAMSAGVLIQVSHAKWLASKYIESRKEDGIPVDAADTIRRTGRYVAESDFRFLGGADRYAHAVTNDPERGQVIDLVRRQIAS